MEATRTLLALGCEDADVLTLERALEQGGLRLEVVPQPSLEAAEAWLAQQPARTLTLIVFDRTNGSQALRTCEVAKAHGLPVVVATTRDGEATVLAWLRAGAAEWLYLPAFPGLTMALARLELRRLQDAEQEQRERRLREATTALLQLTRSPAFRGNDVQAAVRETTEAGARGLCASSCCMWFLEEPTKELKLADGYDATTREHSSGPTLKLAEHSAYFGDIIRERLVAIDDVPHDARTRALAETVLKGVSSTLDVAVRLRGEMVGFLSLQQRGHQRHWLQEEQSYAGALADVVSVALEASERARAEGALRESERRFRDIFEYSNDVIVLNRVALDGTVFGENLNPAGERVTGISRSAIVGRQVQEVVPDPASAAKLASRYRECIAARAPITYTHQLTLPSGVRHFSTHIIPLLDEQGRVYRLASVARDITAQKKAEELERRLAAQSAEGQKNEALARLAEHIAHDVNNLLTLIVAHAQRLGPGGSDAAAAILQATEQGRELTQRVLRFGRAVPPSRVALELGPVVREAVSLLEPTAPRVAFYAEVQPGAAVLGDAAQLKQVLANLCTNAVHSMPEGGTLTVSAEPATQEQRQAAGLPALHSGKWVALSVTDTGQGMDERTTRRIFEPFFTTRGPLGTGLGLAVVHTIVDAHDGHVAVHSAPGQGSTFRVFLPAAAQSDEQVGAGKHLLLVDDHPGVVRVAARLLELVGFRASAFEDPRAALSAMERAPHDFAAVMTDFTMPQMSGQDFVKALRAAAPGVPIIVSSGHALDLSPEEQTALGIAAVLPKPWREDEAIAVLRRVLSL